MTTHTHTGHHRRATRTLGVLVASLIALSPVHGRMASAGSGAATVVGGLSVATDPAGAVVYVDGRFAGRTPLNIPEVAVGDHRLRVVMDGYLENARVVSVSAGEPRKVSITLTAGSAAPAAAAAQVTGGGGGGGGSKKWLWIGAAAGAAAGTLAYTTTRNAAPAAGTIGVSPNGVGMAGQTSFSFAAQGASDPDGDSLTYAWNFGDGGTGSGQTASRVFTASGTYNVTLDVSDGKKSVSAPAASVTVGPNLTGMWSGGRDPFFGCGISISATQNGGTLTGSMMFTSPCTGSMSLASATATPLTHPSTVTWVSQAFEFTDTAGARYPGMTIRFSGTTSSAGTNMSGTITTAQPSSGFTRSSTTTLSK